jgi:hypothetical protein
VVDQRFESLYLFAACRPGTDETFALALPRVNADAMTIFLEHFSLSGALLASAGARRPRGAHAGSGRLARRAGLARA